MSALTVRNLRLPIGDDSVRRISRGSPMASAFYNALSAVFPEGERFFIQSVKMFAHLADGELEADITAFVRQEAIHAREHSAFNRSVGQAGYPIERMSARANHHLDIVREREPIDQLGTTIGLEHFTAVFAAELLRNKRHLAFADETLRTLWRWHAVEEIEHKCVAYDTYLCATQGWSPLRRWAHRCARFTDATRRLCAAALGNMGDIFEAGDTPRKRWGLRLALFLFVAPGMGRVLLPRLAAFYLPGFHPRQMRDGALLNAARSSLPQPQAQMQAA